MDTLEVIKARRSIRKFAEKPVEPELLEQILEAARWAPSGSNAQRWEFILISDKRVIDSVRRVSPGLLGTPAAIIVICSHPSAKATDWQKSILGYDCAMAAQNMMLAACSLGLGSCVALSFSRTAVQEILEVPPGVTPELLVTLGYPAESPLPPKRKELSQLVHLNIYGRGVAK